MDLCELDLLLSICLFEADKKDLAFDALERALKIVRRRKYYRLIADEGEPILRVMAEYVVERKGSVFLENLIVITRSMAIAYPLYLKRFVKGSLSFSKTELDILRLMEQGKSKEDIARFFLLTVNTVKYYQKKIYAKLDVSRPTQAVWKAKAMGLI
jgi:DNA-binding CsgD family transcriptional regulator